MKWSCKEVTNQLNSFKLFSTFVFVLDVCVCVLEKEAGTQLVSDGIYKPHNISRQKISRTTNTKNRYNVTHQSFFPSLLSHRIKIDIQIITIYSFLV